MRTLEDKIKGIEFIGIVEDNNDPEKKQRVKIRVPYLHGSKEEIPTEAIPWAQPYRDNNGLTFSIPEINKIINVTFPSGNLYFPVYKNAEHLNINLQKKIESYEGNDYTKFVAICYNYNTQLFFDNENLSMYYKKSGINIDEEEIILKKRDSSVKIKLGNENANQPFVNGEHYFNFFDKLMNTLLDAYIGNLGAPIAPNPKLINLLNEYKSKRSTFISTSVFSNDNTDNTINDIELELGVGDSFDNSGLLSEKEELIFVQEKEELIKEEESKIVVIQDEVVNNIPKTLAGTNNIETEDIIVNKFIVDVKETKTDELEDNTTIIEKEYEEDDFFGNDEETYDNYDENIDIFEDDSDENIDYTIGSGIINDETTDTDYNYTPYDGKITNTDLTYNYNNKSWPNIKKNLYYDIKYEMLINPNNMPKPKLNKKSLIDVKLKLEGGLSRAKTDAASKNSENICPTPYNGQYGYHTNKGITYSVWVNRFGKNKDNRFLNMSHEDWLSIFDKLYWNKNISSQYESVNTLLVSFAWGGSKGRTVEIAEKILKGKLRNFDEKTQCCALLSARFLFFLSISQPGKSNNANRDGWCNNAMNKFVKSMFY